MTKINFLYSKSFIVISIFSIFLISMFSQNSFGFEENLLALQTGIISTANEDYAISNEYQVRVFHDGKLMRISGVTTTDETFYLYQYSNGEDIRIHGKIFSEGRFIPLILREQVEEQKPLVVPKSDLIMAVKLSKYTYSNYPFTIAVKVFDAKKNPQAVFDQTYGVRENIPVVVTISTKSGQVVSSMEGITDSRGLFNDTYIVRERVVSQGEYDVKVTIDGNDDTSQSFKTFFRGDIRDYFHNTN